MVQYSEQNRINFNNQKLIYFNHQLFNKTRSSKTRKSPKIVMTNELIKGFFLSCLLTSAVPIETPLSIPSPFNLPAYNL